ncbi:hypothetical protein BpHYR1_034851 [Brachionus plicatilis]|uniref:Uncharacterized protein n=1 Tax=Brachionus plicatilis TaxID=10195 RepID=A0A3M7P774_BRAPC|nr:hypothetical protein BpHYR1_034851 [Brachionus plicatilis]
MRQAKRDEHERVERAIAERIEDLTDSDIKNEVKKLWAKNGINKQSVSKIDRESAKPKQISRECSHGCNGVFCMQQNFVSTFEAAISNKEIGEYFYVSLPEFPSPGFKILKTEEELRRLIC